jgi:DNA-binding winged helix-turn-helix (wHTH) protein/tetratricopeptide (TPR) repeat protein
MSQEAERSQGARTRLPVGAFVLDLARETLVGPEGEVRLRPKTYEVLRYLLAHRGRIVTKPELIDAAWGETSVTDDSLVQCLIEIRRALGDRDHRLIRTIPRRGYMVTDEAWEAGQTAWNGDAAPITDVRDAPDAVPRRNVRWPMWSLLGLLAVSIVVGALYMRRAPVQSPALFRQDRPELAPPATSNPEAYDLYLAGRRFFEKRTETDLWSAITHFKQALDLDERFAYAYAGVAQSYCVLTTAGAVPQQQAVEWLRAYATKALDLDPRLAEAHTAMAVYHAHQWNPQGQEESFKRAIDANPHYPTAYLWYGNMLDTYGRRDESLAMRRAALKLEPLNPQINVELADILHKMGQHDEALKHIDTALGVDPDYPGAFHTLGRFHLAAGRYAEATKAFVKSGRRPSIAHAYAVSGDRDRARSILRQLEQETTRRYVSPLDFAVIHAGLGDNDQAFAWLDRAFSERVIAIKWFDSDVWFVRLRDDPRYATLSRRVRAAMQLTQ